MNMIKAEFDSVERAEAAASKLRDGIEDLGKITIESRKVKKDLDTPFMLPYAPQNGLDPWVMLPANYGYATDSGYLENYHSVVCKIEAKTESDADKVRKILFNFGATDFDSFIKY